MISVEDFLQSGIVAVSHKEISGQPGLELPDQLSNLPKEFTGASTDTRKIHPGQIFFCLQGPNFDAHNFVDVALQKGAAAVVIQKRKRPAVLELLEKSKPSDKSQPIFECDEPLEAMQNLARLHRRREGYCVFAITGSNGKTSAKEMLLGMLSHILGADSVDATTGNLNNHIGLPLTILNFKPGISHAILELGMNHAGEIDLLSSIAQPDHGLITSVGRAHIEFFYSRRGIVRAKQELADHCNQSLTYPASAIGKGRLYRRKTRLKGNRTGQDLKPAIALFGFDGDSGWNSVPAAARQNPEWKMIRAHGVEFGPKGNSFDLNLEGSSCRIENSHYFSRVQAENLLGCVTTLWMAGFLAQQIVDSAAHAAPVSGGRFHVLRKDDRILVDDTYNANPDSFLAAIASLRKMLPEGKLLCLAGEMAELGQSSASGHREVGADLNRNGYQIQAIGNQGAMEYLRGSGVEPEVGFFFSNSSELADHIEKHPQLYLSYDGILAKGSRSARMEKACDALKRIGYV